MVVDVVTATHNKNNNCYNWCCYFNSHITCLLLLLLLLSHTLWDGYCSLLSLNVESTLRFFLTHLHHAKKETCFHRHEIRTSCSRRKSVVFFSRQQKRWFSVVSAAPARAAGWRQPRQLRRRCC